MIDAVGANMCFNKDTNFYEVRPNKLHSWNIICSVINQLI